MPTLTVPATSHTAVSTGWTNPSNAFATTGDNVYATAQPAAASTVSGDFAPGNVGPIGWTLRTSGFGTTEIRGLGFGNGYWVAVGASGKLATSDDGGVTWTLHSDSSFGTSPINHVHYADNLWVAVSNGNKIATATDPTGTWTQRDADLQFHDLEGVHYGNGLWVVAADGGQFITSEDGINWTALDPGLGQFDLYDIEYGNGVWVAVGEKLVTSPDGTNWTERTFPVTSGDLDQVGYGDGRWVIVGTSVNDGRLATATDPTGTWTEIDYSQVNPGNLISVGYADGLWLIGGFSSGVGTHAISTNGTDWTAYPAPLGTSGGNSFAHNGQWVVAGSSGLLATGSTDDGIPDGATIDEVRIVAEIGADAEGLTLGLQGRLDGANSGTETTKTTTTEEQIIATLSGVTLTDLRSASTLLAGRVRATRD